MPTEQQSTFVSGAKQVTDISLREGREDSDRETQNIVLTRLSMWFTNKETKGEGAVVVLRKDKLPNYFAVMLPFACEAKRCLYICAEPTLTQDVMRWLCGSSVDPSLLKKAGNLEHDHWQQTLHPTCVRTNATEINTHPDLCFDKEAIIVDAETTPPSETAAWNFLFSLAHLELVVFLDKHAEWNPEMSFLFTATTEKKKRAVALKTTCEGCESAPPANHTLWFCQPID